MTEPNDRIEMLQRTDSGLIVLNNDASRIHTDIPPHLRAELMGGPPPAAPFTESVTTSPSIRTIGALTDQAARDALAHAPDAVRRAAMVGGTGKEATPLIAIAGSLPSVAPNSSNALIAQPSLDGSFSARAFASADTNAVRAALRGGQLAFTQPRPTSIHQGR